jgi:outer membrane protein assembly factor BamB
VVHQERVFTSNIFGSFLVAGAEVRPAEPANTQPAEARKPGELLWRQSTAGYLSSPVVRDGHAYLHLYNQRFACLDLATGKQKWHTKPLGTYWSMVMQGDKVLTLSERGVLRMFAVSPTACDALGEVEFKDENGKPRSTWAHLAVVGREVYVRDLTGLSAYGLGK